jgi:carboxypeptidase A4
MKVFAVSLAALGLASAASVAKKVNYDGWKVYRVNVGGNAAKLSDVMDSLQLSTWKGKVATSKVVDVMVPPTQIEKFEQSGLDTELMHDDLGASISVENTFHVYAGINPRAELI